MPIYDSKAHDSTYHVFRTCARDKHGVRRLDVTVQKIDDVDSPMTIAATYTIKRTGQTLALNAYDVVNANEFDVLLRRSLYEHKDYCDKLVVCPVERILPLFTKEILLNHELVKEQIACADVYVLYNK